MNFKNFISWTNQFCITVFATFFLDLLCNARRIFIIIIDNSDIKPTKIFSQPNDLRAMHLNALNPLYKTILVTLIKIGKKRLRLFLSALINLKIFLTKLLAIQTNNAQWNANL